MRFAHFADVHIRPLDRHDEYRDTFQNFFDKAPEYNLDAIVIAGDILHEKTQRITPEVIDFLVWLLNGLAKVAPVHIILGNHDGNLKNLQRKDAISPIVKALDNPNIHLYLKSGVYQINDDFVFCAYSPFDEPGWEDVSPVKGKVNICLFHGCVVGSYTDLGFQFDDGEANIDFFKDYDFTFLGDIHKLQFMGKEQRIAYPGSTIQQNFGESINNHGFLLWDIKAKHDFTVEHIEFENKKPYVTLNWDGKIEDLMLEAKRYPDESRFRIWSENKVQAKEKKIIENELKSKKKSSLIKFKNEKAKGNTIEDEVSKRLRFDLTIPETIVDLLKKFNGEENFSQEQWKDIHGIVETYLEEVGKTEETWRGATWIPRRLEFSNVLGFREDNIVNFDECEGIVGLFAPNMSGKSTIVAAMTYCLFGRIDRDVNQNQHAAIVNNRRDGMSITFYFTIAGKTFKIKRVTEKVEKKDGRYGVKGQVYLWEVSDDLSEELEELHAEKTTETEKVIRNIVGTLEDFKLTALSNQRNVEAFMKERVTTRKQHLARYRDLDTLDKLHKMSNTDWSERKSILKTLSSLDWDDAILSLNDEKKKISGEISRHESLLETLRDAVSRIKSDIEKQGGTNVITPSDLLKKEGQIDSLKESVVNQKEFLEKLEEKLFDWQTMLTDTKKEKDSIDIDKIKEKLRKKNELDKQIFKLGEKYKSEKKVLESKEKTVKKLDVVPCGDEYPTCKYIRDAHEEKNKIKPQKELLKSIEKDIQKLQALVVDGDEFEKKIKEYDDLSMKEMKIQRKISEISIENAKDKFESLKDKLHVAEKEYANMKLNAKDSDSVKELKEKLDQANKEIKETDGKRILCATRIGEIESNIQRLLADKEKYEEVFSECQIYEALTFSFGKKGIPNQILRADIPSINAEIKEILKDIDGIDAVEFELEEESDKLDIYVESDEERIPIELSSGAQLVMASIALRVGLMRVSNLPKPDMLILDEPFENLDDTRVESVILMIETLKKWFDKVLLVTHKDPVKDIADTSIEILTRGKDSYVLHE